MTEKDLVSAASGAKASHLTAADRRKASGDCVKRATYRYQRVEAARRRVV